MRAVGLNAVRCAAGGFASREDLEAALTGARRLAVVIACPDLDRMAQIGGFAAAERSRARLEAGLFRLAPEGATIARLGGDYWGLSALARSMAEAEEIATDFAGGFNRAAYAGALPRLGAIWSERGAPPAEMLAAALAALDGPQAPFGAPEVGRFSAAPVSEAAIARNALAAIRAGAVTVAFQPVVDAETPGRVMFSEALIRILRPDGREVPAGAFMPALERFGLAAEADIAMLGLVFDALEADPARRLSLNLSTDSLRAPDWAEAFSVEIARRPRAAERLIVEMSERMEEDDLPDLLSVAALIRSSGAALALDDFGAGRTSFRSMRDIRYDMVKIDRGFVRGVDRSPDKRALIAALASVARRFEMMVIAEHVETAQEARALRRLGVDGFQGFLFGAPTLVWSEGGRVAPAG